MLFGGVCGVCDGVSLLACEINCCGHYVLACSDDASRTFPCSNF